MLNKRIDSQLKLPDSFPEFKSDIYGDRYNILRKTLNRKEVMIILASLYIHYLMISLKIYI